MAKDIINLNCAPPCANIISMEEHVKNIDEKIDSFVADFKMFRQEFKDELKEIKKSKANKWAEDAWKAAGVLAIITVLGYVMSHVGLPKP